MPREACGKSVELNYMWITLWIYLVHFLLDSPNEVSRLAGFGLGSQSGSLEAADCSAGFRLKAAKPESHKRWKAFHSSKNQGILPTSSFYLSFLGLQNMLPISIFGKKPLSTSLWSGNCLCQSLNRKSSRATLSLLVRPGPGTAALRLKPGIHGLGFNGNYL